MAIKITSTYDIKEVLKENGIDYSDFISYIDSKSEKPNESIIEDKDQNTLIYVIDRYISVLKQNDLLQIKSKNTTKYYLSFLTRLKQFINIRNKDLLFSQFNEVVFNDFINDININKNIKISHGSINTYIAIVRRLCSFAAEENLISKNINFRFNLLRTSTLPRYFSKNQLTVIFIEINKLKNPHLWRTIFITFLGTGLRIHELAGLKIKDFDIETKLIFTLGKGKKERYVPIYPSVKQAVMSYLETTGVNNLNLAKDEYLFSKTYGHNRKKPISIRCIQNNFQKITEKLQLENHFSVHSFRHTFAVNCLKANMQPIYLCQILGHSSPASTAVYTQLLPRDLQQVVDEKYPFPLEKLIQQILNEGND
ncbi:tyrosine-type recombinase/integrase [Paenisporosarcina sp.]|uniref:tyrosine-type recombinase/integrase n=1 Tax=Paenisporosarcina sp. TaxID=1932001 RepID=UPI003C76BCAF